MAATTEHETAHSHVETKASHARTDGTVHSIEHDLGKNHTDKLSPHVREEIYGELAKLHKTDGKHFNEDLASINAKLQHDGYLPHMFIIANTDKDKGAAGEQFGPKDKTGYHLGKEEVPSAPLAPKGQPVDQSAPPAAPLAPGQVDQPTWHAQNPGNPVGSNGGEGNIGGSTPISGGDVQSNPVAGGVLSSPQLVSEIQSALQLLNAQRAAEGLPPIADNAANEKAILEIIQHESSGNPNAQNNSDSNAAAGHPSKGLMQTIAGTFSSYHVQGTSSNIFDPVANIAAGVNYAVSRYGSLASVPGIKALNSGGSYVGY